MVNSTEGSVVALAILEELECFEGIDVLLVEMDVFIIPLFFLN